MCAKDEQNKKADWFVFSGSELLKCHLGRFVVKGESWWCPSKIIFEIWVVLDSFSLKILSISRWKLQFSHLMQAPPPARSPPLIDGSQQCHTQTSPLTSSINTPPPVLRNIPLAQVMTKIGCLRAQPQTLPSPGGMKNNNQVATEASKVGCGWPESVNNHTTTTAYNDKQQEHAAGRRQGRQRQKGRW
jgi:hypothetical protein